MATPTLTGTEMLRVRPRTYWTAHYSRIIRDGVISAMDVLRYSTFPVYHKALGNGDLTIINPNEKEEKEEPAVKFVDEQPHEEIELSDEAPKPKAKTKAKKRGRPPGSKNKNSKKGM